MSSSASGRSTSSSPTGRRRARCASPPRLTWSNTSATTSSSTHRRRATRSLRCCPRTSSYRSGTASSSRCRWRSCTSSIRTRRRLWRANVARINQRNQAQGNGRKYRSWLWPRHIWNRWRNSMSKFRLVAPFMILMLVLTACPAGDTGDGDGDGGPAASGEGGEGTGAEGDGTISVTSLWGGAEGEAFQVVLDAFEAETGIVAEYETVRDDYATVLSTRATGGTPPDVAIMPGIGFMQSFAKDGLLIPLEDLGIARADIEDRFAPGILDIGTVDDVLYAPMVKLNSKSTVWYHPSSFDELGLEVPTTYDDMVALGDAYDGPAWACGCGDTWNLTDWFESIYIRQHGVEMYDQLFGGELPFTDQSVKDSITEMTRILNEE